MTDLDKITDIEKSNMIVKLANIINEGFVDYKHKIIIKKIYFEDLSLIAKIELE